MTIIGRYLARYLAAVILSLAAITLPSTAQAQNVVFDVAGVKIGMTPAKVKAEMAKRGYILVATGMRRPQKGPSFEDKLAASNGASERARAKSVVKKLSFEQGDQRLSVAFSPFPSGPKVNQVSYNFSNLADGCANFMKQVRAKYGPDEKGYDSFANWQDRPSGARGFHRPGTILLKAKCHGGTNLSMIRYGTQKEIEQLILSKSKGVPRDF